VRLTGLAPAKVNLLLHVGPIQPDGYHPLVSLVAFADVGDRVTVSRSDRLSLAISGPFADGLQDDGDNLVLRVLRALGRATGQGDPPLRVELDKRLPIAAGLGGGSSDAAAALRLADRLLGLDLGSDRLEAIASEIGADGPMCVRARTVWAEGRGDVLSDACGWPSLDAVLVNPGLPSPTGAVYRAYDQAPRQADPPVALAQGADLSRRIDWLSAARNDLQSPAVAREPGIGEALRALEAASGVALVRMSGSGSTVFGLFRNSDDAREAARDLASRQPGWWVRACRLGGDPARIEPAD